MPADHRMYRRFELSHVILAVVAVAGAIAIATLGHEPVVGMAFGLDLLAVFYFIGPAATVVVTPMAVLINNVFVRHIIPRQCVQGVFEQRGSARLQAAGRTFRTSAFDDIIFYKSLGARPTPRRVRRITRMMEEVPAAPASQGVPKSRPRPGHLLLAALAALIFPALTIYARLHSHL
jgi:hypothetical protein